MIDINNIRNVFLNYASKYDIANPKITLKINHIQRVADVSKLIAESLNLNEEEIALAEAIGYFHDIGRFEQVRIANTFSDRESHINHAQKSVDVLFENNFIREFIPETKYDDIIKKAVLNHNKANIEPNLTEKELLFSKIIRDADKLDILYTITVDNFPAAFWYNDFDCEKINEEIINQYKKQRIIDYSLVKTSADQILCFYGFIFDLNFPFSLQYLRKKNYMEDFRIRIRKYFTSSIVLKQVDEVHEIYKNYINNI